MVADVTYGEKVPEEVKEELNKLKSSLGLTGKDFIQILLNAYKVESAKEKIPEVAQDIKELQGLTQRINNIYLSIGYRIESLISTKEQELQEQSQAKDKIIFNLQSLNEDLNLEKDNLVEAFNTSVNDKDELNKRVNELTESNNNIRELNGQYKSKFDTMAGIVEEYKSYKTQIEEYKKLLADSQRRNIELTNSVKEKDQIIEKLNSDIKVIAETKEKVVEELTIKHDDKIKSITEKLKFEKDKSILELKSEYQDEIQDLQNKHNTEIQEYQARYRNLLEELEHIRKSADSTTHNKNNRSKKQNATNKE